MMASKKPGPGSSRPLQRAKKQAGPTQYLIIAGVAVVVIVVLLVALGSSKKQSPVPKAKSVASADRGATPKRGRTAPAVGRIPKEDRRAAQKEARRKQRLEARGQAREGGGRRTRRSESGGFSRGSSGRATGSSTNQLKAIIYDDNSKTRFALVGARKYKIGDNVDGRQILEVSSDAVKVEYQKNQYTVKIGQTIY